MAMQHNISLHLHNATLVRLIEEQFINSKFVSFDASLPPDCIIRQAGAPHIGLSSDIPIIELPKGSLRIGEILDKIKYALSGRETHIENDADQFDLGAFILFPAENLLTQKPGGKSIRLTDKERLLLRILYQTGENGLPRKDLLKGVWGYASDAETHTLETHIYRLRQKLEPVGGQDLIRTENGYYILDIKKPT
jgi:hypothetical protein